MLTTGSTTEQSRCCYSMLPPELKFMSLPN